MLADRFTEAMIIICEGQGLDKMFEEQQSITADEYLDMISRKTAALIQLSCELGAIIADADQMEIKQLHDFGFNLGMGFQVQDDILDITADQDTLGKKVGSDFEMQKQTVLSIKLRQKIGRDKFDSLDLNSYTKLLKNEGILDEVGALAENYFSAARQNLNDFAASEHKRLMLEIVDDIQHRTW